MPEPRPLHDHLAEFVAAVTGRPSEEWETLSEAMFAAAEFHGPQRRKGGQLYMVHPIEVACILATHGADLPTIMAGLLHDVLEDTKTPAAEIEARFGTEVLRLVEALSHNLFPSKEAMLEETERAGAIDPRIIDIRLADRAANLMRGSALHLRPDRHLHHLEEAERFHMARLAAVPGVNPGITDVLRHAIADSWKDYHSRKDIS